MNPTLVARLEKALVLLIAVSFTLPLVISGVLLIPRTDVPGTAWLRNATLFGVQHQPAEVAFSRAAVLSGKSQSAFAENYNFHFAGRELMIRLINELYLRVFHLTFVGVVVGPDYSLVQEGYAFEYCLARIGKDALRPLVENLRRMQDFCDARGMAFALVITPSKAAIYPEGLPPSWLRHYQPGPRGYDRFLPLLRENGIRCVDGHRITADLKPTAQVPLFALGSAHWGEPAALATANALLSSLASQGLDVRPIQNYRTKISNDPAGQDFDDAELINIVSPMRYPVANIAVQPTTPIKAARPNVVFIGGSFTTRMLEQLDASRQFSELEQYFYYKNSHTSIAEGAWHLISAPTRPLNFETEVFAADALVLEVNEEVLCLAIAGRLEVAHLKAFLHDALAVLPDPHAVKTPFHYETRIDYQWGDTLCFVADKANVNTGAMSGFSLLTPVGTYTLGNVAELDLIASAPEQDMVLEIEAGSFLVDTRLPEQRVKVYSNGHAVGEWIWRVGTPPHHELIIPKEFLSGGKVKLEFHIAKPSSPADFGLSLDPNKYGIFISSARLHEAGK